MSKPKADVYLTADELAERLKDRVTKADALPPGPVKQCFMKEIVSLRAHVDMKRWIEAPGPKRGP